MAAAASVAYVLLVAMTPLASAMLGFDISLQDCNGAFSTPDPWTCFGNSGYGFGVIQAVQGGNGMTKAVTQCVGNAAAAGFAVSLYGFFCPVCEGQTDGVNAGLTVMQTLKSQGILPGLNFTYFYVDVEDCDPYDNCWESSAVNQLYLLDVVQGLQQGGASVAIYASPYEWQKLMGDAGWSNPALTSLPLWYPNWNGNQDMSGFEAFGGWTAPHMHQYADSCSTCYNVDQDYGAF